jgi:hypothetical protein
LRWFVNFNLISHLVTAVRDPMNGTADVGDVVGNARAFGRDPGDLRSSDDAALRGPMNTVFMRSNQ